MTKILNFALKIKGGGREGGTCEVLRPCHPLKIWNVHLGGKIESNVVTCANRGFADHDYLQINGRFSWVFTAGSSQKFNLSQFSR